MKNPLKKQTFDAKIVVFKGLGYFSVSFCFGFGRVLTTFMALSGLAMTAARFKPVMEMARPILDAEPEVSEGKQVIDRILESYEDGHR